MSLDDALALLVLSTSMTCRHDVPALTDPNVIRVAEIYDSDAELAGHIDAALVDLLSERITGAWGEGWQPADIVRVLRRNSTDLMATMAADSMAAHLATYEPATVDEAFPVQLAALQADRDFGAPAGFARRWARRTGADTITGIAVALEVADALGHLPELPHLCPPPGQAGRAHRSRSNDTAEPKLLERVRALLAKAESSEYGAEADSFTAKAQELILRHSIDHALLSTSNDSPEQPGGIRIGLDNPYETEKAMLLDRIATANRCKSIWSRHLGFVTVLGYPADLRAVELLFTSLLVQSTRAMISEGPRRSIFGGSRTRSFRRSFLNAFAVRIGERLSGVTDAGTAEGAAVDPRLLPVLAGRRQTVIQFAEALFPDMARQSHTSAHDGEGWAMGVHAANLAALSAIPSIAETRSAHSTTADVTAPGDAVQDPLFPVPHYG